jgi:hypothetical protein
LLKIVKKMLLKDNELPTSMYEAKKIVCPLGLEVQKIHACPNECILYRGEEYKNLNACPVCSAFGIRSGEITLLMLRESTTGRGFLPR